MYVTASPYHSDLDTPLLAFGNEIWAIRDAAEGTAIWGAPGSGKSSGSGKAIAKAFLSAGMGGLVLCAKNDEAATWKRYAQDTGRIDDLIIVDEHADQRFNFLAYAAENLATPGFEQNLVDLMARLSEAFSVAESKGGDNDQSYFIKGAMQWLSHAFPLLQLAFGTVRMRDLNEFIVTAPQSPADIPENLQNLSQDDLSFCLKTHILAGERAQRLKTEAEAAKASNQANATQLEKKSRHAMQMIADHGDFFLDTLLRLDQRPRSSIESTLSNITYPFISGKIAELFCTDSTFSPNDCRDGKIIILDLPTLRYGAAGAAGQTMFKYLFGLAAQNIIANEKTRPIFLYADEAQFFLNSADADLLSTARSSKTCIVYITQDLPTYYAKMGSNARDVAESILSKFGTRIFHTNTSRETNQYASEIIGKVEKFHKTRSTSRGASSGGGGASHDTGSGYNGHDGTNIGETEGLTGYLDAEIPPDFFATRLRKGSAGSHFKVDGIVISNGRNWKATNRHWIKAEFNQKS